MVIVSAGISGSVSKLDTLPPSHSSAMAGSLRFCIHMAGSPAEASTKLKRRLVEAVGYFEVSEFCLTSKLVNRR